MSMIFVNTRPSAHATTYRETLLGDELFWVVDLPLLDFEFFEVLDKTGERCLMHLLAIDNVDADDADKDKIDTHQKTKSYAVVVMVSRTAVTAFVRYLIKNLKHKHDKLFDINASNAPCFVAVGKATVRELGRHGIGAISPVSDCGAFAENNEGMLKLAPIKKLTAGDRVLILKGVGGRRLLIDTLRARGVCVDTLDLYRRICPHDLIQNVHKLAHMIDVCNPSAQDALWLVVLITSQVAFEHWCQAVQATALLDRQGLRVYYLTLGVRLTNIVNQQCQMQGDACAQQINDLGAQTIQRALDVLVQTKRSHSA